MKQKKWLLLVFTGCLLVAGLSPLASRAPDGLERVAVDHGFAGLASPAPFQVVADYVFPGIRNETLATVMAAVLGTAFVFVVMYGLAYILRRRAGQHDA